MKRSFSSSEHAERIEVERSSAERRRGWILGFVVIAVVVFAIAAEGLFRTNRSTQTDPTEETKSLDEFEPIVVHPVTPASTPAYPHARSDPVVLPSCRVNVIHKQDVPTQREGVLLWVGTELGAGESVEEDRLLVLNCAGTVRRIRLWKEGDVIEAGQLLAQLDDRLPVEDVRIRQAKALAAKADASATQKIFEEAKQRFEVQDRLWRNGTRATSAEEYRGAKLAMDRARFDVMSKQQLVNLSESELHQAETILALYQIRSSIPGVIKTVYRHAGESIHSLEPVVQVWSTARLRVEGQVDVQHLPRLRQGMLAIVEPTFAISPRQTLLGHLQEITSVAVSNNPTAPRILSGSEDGTVRVWDLVHGREQHIWKHDSPVRALACTPPTSAADLCLSGTSDGKLRIWDLQADSADPLRELQGGHQGAIGCVAFSLDGRFCATGGEDRNIILWETETGALRYRFSDGHRAAVTSLQFTPLGQLVSAGRDNTVRLWDVGEQQARSAAVFDRRAGDVASIGVRPDGRVALFDQGPNLRLLSLPRGLTEGVLRQTSDGARFAVLAQYSPDGRMILTSSGGLLQLWIPPSQRCRGYAHCQLGVSGRDEITCAAFSPHGSLLVTGTKNHQVLLWPTPTAADLDHQLIARLTLVEQALDTSTRQVRIRAEITNTRGLLLPGTTVTLAVYPR